MITLLVLVGVGYLIFRRIRYKILNGKIEKMKAERIVLLNLVKKAQTDRYANNTLSEFVYKIRLKKYNQRLEGIKQVLLVIESQLRKMREKVKSTTRKDKLVRKVNKKKVVNIYSVRVFQLC